MALDDARCLRVPEIPNAVSDPVYSPSRHEAHLGIEFFPNMACADIDTYSRIGVFQNAGGTF